MMVRHGKDFNFLGVLPQVYPGLCVPLTQYSIIALSHFTALEILIQKQSCFSAQPSLWFNSHIHP